MVWEVPTGIIGEFDTLEGPKVSYVSEFFGFNTANHTGAHNVTFNVLGTPFYCGRNVASGLPRTRNCERITSVVAHALATQDSQEESIILQDPIVGAVACLTFSISDIFARGEKRAFCILLTHPHNDVLVSRWPVVIGILQLLSRGLAARAQLRFQRDYTRYGNQKQSREAMREKPLRSLLELMLLSSRLNQGSSKSPVGFGSPNLSTNTRDAFSEGRMDAIDVAIEDVFKQIHCCFDCLLPAAFSKNKPLPFSLAMTSSAMQAYLLDRVDKDIPILHSCIRVVSVRRRTEKTSDGRDSVASKYPAPSPSSAEAVVSLPRRFVSSAPCRGDYSNQIGSAECDDASEFIITHSAWNPLCEGRLNVSPSARWLLTASPSADLEMLLKALFSGNQLIFTGPDCYVCGAIAVAFSEALPPSLRKTVIFSDVYLMPYECQLLSFSEAFLNRYAVVPVRGFVDKEQFVLSELAGDNVVQVVIDEYGCIVTVQSCDALLDVGCEEAVQTKGVEVGVPTIVQRLLYVLTPLKRHFVAAHYDDAHSSRTRGQHVSGSEVNPGSHFSKLKDSRAASEVGNGKHLADGDTTTDTGKSKKGQTQGVPRWSDDDGSGARGLRNRVGYGCEEYDALQESLCKPNTENEYWAHCRFVSALQSHIDLLVSEYVFRGRVYKRLHTQKEQTRRSATLGWRNPRRPFLCQILRNIIHFSSSRFPGHDSGQYSIATSQSARRGEPNSEPERKGPSKSVAEACERLLNPTLPPTRKWRRVGYSSVAEQRATHISTGNINENSSISGTSSGPLSSSSHYGSGTSQSTTVNDHCVLLFLGSATTSF